MFDSDNVLCHVFPKVQIDKILFAVAHTLYQRGTSFLWPAPQPEPIEATGTQVPGGCSSQI